MTASEQVTDTLTVLPAEPSCGSGPQSQEPSDNLQEVVEHLLFHKALADHDPGRLEHYVRVAQADVTSFREPFNKAIAIAFQLVLDEHLDPWSIDLVQFSRSYAERLAEAEEVDLITSGRLLAMAWRVLLAQTDALLERAQPEEPEPEADPWDLPWEAFPDDWGDPSEDPDVQYTDRVLHDPDPPISESVFHKGDRRVTLYELVEALEEARDEAERRQRLARERRKAREGAKEEGKENVKKIHKEDLEAEIADVRRRLEGLPLDKEVSLTAIHDGTREDFLSAFVSSLFLHRAEMADVRQENFPFGPILVTPRAPLHDPEAKLVGVPKEGEAAARAQAAAETKTAANEPDEPDATETDDQPTDDQAGSAADAAEPATAAQEVNDDDAGTPTPRAA